MKKLLIFTLFSLSLLLNAKDIDTLTLSYAEYDSNSVYKNGPTVDIHKYSYNLTYVKSLPDYIFRVKYKNLPKQRTASTIMGGMNIDVEQEALKLEIGGAYKYYINKSTYIGPALSYDTLEDNIKQKLANGSNIKSKVTETDLRAFIVLGTSFSKLNSLFVSFELDNDLKSNDTEKDFNHYPLSATFNQIISRELYLSATYNTILREKDATATETGQTKSDSIEFGIGYVF